MRIGKKSKWKQCERVEAQYGMNYFREIMIETKNAVLAKGRKWRGA